MLKELTLRLAPEIAYENQKLADHIAEELNIDSRRIKKIDLTRRSIDARQRRVMINLAVTVHIDEIDESLSAVPPTVYPDVREAPQVIVVGAGPAGLFAALRLIENGFRPIVLERGKDVDERRKDMAAISRDQKVNPESNYCFGEGGAGAFSDGKLYTRSKKRGSIDKVLRVFVDHGADRNILIDAHPHIGTDRLPGVIKAIRSTIINSGGKVIFNKRVDLLIVNGHRVTGVITSDGDSFEGPVILASGHSARDIYRMLDALSVTMQPKGIAVGVRLEHPQSLIDRIQYHSPKGRGKYLPPAEYSMLTRVGDRAVYSFCMCPGGFIIPAASDEGQLAVNGMSPSNRGTRWANSGMVVEILPEDLPDYDSFGQLKMMNFQEDIEHTFHEAASQTQHAPAQRMTDFVAGKLSESLPDSSYAPGIFSSRVDKLLPKAVAYRLQQAFAEFGRKSHGFLSDEAIVVGDETRTSAPVQISRDPEKLCHIEYEGLYPCGEGAGYAGGIVSAAIDGIRCADAVSDHLHL